MLFNHSGTVAHLLWCLCLCELAYSLDSEAAAAASEVSQSPNYWFTKGDHPSMVNDDHRLNFYQHALEHAMHTCHPGCTVLEIGPGSGVLTMLAARAGAAHVLAVEADAAVVSLARAVVAKNQQRHFPYTNVTIIEGYSQDIMEQQLPLGQRVDILVSEIFGNEFLDENVLDIVPDVRDRLVKPGGIVIPAGGCQYVTLVEAPSLESSLYPSRFDNLDLRGLRLLVDPARKYPSNVYVRALSERMCVTSVDFYKHGKELPQTRTFFIRATASGTVHAALLDFDLWADRLPDTETLSTAQRSKDFETSSWVPVLQTQQEFDHEWKIRGKVPRPLTVTAGEWLEVAVQYFKQEQGNGKVPRVYLYVITRHAVKSDAPAGQRNGSETLLPSQAGKPAFAKFVKAGFFSIDDVADANIHDLFIASDNERMRFYSRALEQAISEQKSKKQTLFVLDCSGGFGTTALMAAKHHNIHITAVAKSKGHQQLILQLAAVNRVQERLRVDLVGELDLSADYDIVILEPPMRHNPIAATLSPFAWRKQPGSKSILKKSGTTVPAKCCLEAGMVESFDFAKLIAVPGGSTKGFDFASMSNEASGQGTVAMASISRAFGEGFIGNASFEWLSMPKCVFILDFKRHVRGKLFGRRASTMPLTVEKSGHAHALLARWTVLAETAHGEVRLGPERNQFGRELLWQEYVQPVTADGDVAGMLAPLDVQAGETWNVQLNIWDAADSYGNTRPDFQLRILRKDKGKERLEL